MKKSSNMPDPSQIDYPTDRTLEKYGLTREDFYSILERQGFVCPICGMVPTPSKTTGKRRWVIEHVHVRGWKDMPPEKKRTYIRGITCWRDNYFFLSKGITAELAANIITYLNGERPLASQ